MHPQQPAASAVALTAKYAWPTFVLGLIRPVVTINGYRVPAR